MESLSFESTIESPTKPHQEKLPDKNSKSLFLVQTQSDTDIPKQDISNLENNESKEIIEKKPSALNTLNFDDILEIVFPKQKPKKPAQKNNSKKILSSKRKRSINKSKKYFYNLFIIIFLDINGKTESHLAKGKESTNTNNNKNNKKINEDIYNINNFYSSTVKIREKSLYQNVVVPKFEELDEDFFEDNCIEVSLIYNFIIIIIFLFQDEENINDETYNKIHDIFEQKEIDYRKQIYENFEKKKSQKEIKKEIEKIQKAHKNLYNIFDINGVDGLNIEESHFNIIRIKLF